ncbi:Gfo/Idh/MocA family protein [Alicyclobacillus kakegawensis]|uniref:Gfo/Idh/MocA family protein n=1 Tax=Alicyclobacillus kakegawensis TaxID=392012 RepID=UPI000834248F|nr:Gfo/Idh/MocA family oxidoreductase [Alicyclobacillus kakegawensis]
MERVGVGIIGCGNISGIYLKNFHSFKSVKVVACADIDIERARAKAQEFNIPKACSVEELLSDPDVQIVVNLTVPTSHAQVSMAALEAGKHVYTEKPLAVSLEDGKRILEAAASKGLLVGGAPDTFLGGGLQTCRQIIDDGLIGKPIGATAFMVGRGPEDWHPNPAFFYQEGGGPMFDMGPYYLTALVALIGPVKRIAGCTSTPFGERTTMSGVKIPVSIPTHVAGLLEFENGAVGTIITSFDVWGSKLPHIEIYGERGTISVPDPNTYDGPVFLKPGSGDWREIPVTKGYTDNSRGIGLADMVDAMRTGREHRANSALLYHVLEIMHGIHISSNEGRHYEVSTLLQRPNPLDPTTRF